MNAEDLDHSYTELCRAMARVGEAQTPLFLAQLCLALMVRESAPAAVLAAIQRAEAQCG